jgi:hydroxymethylpyrimidine pyrophosphatase-like HAD family hydrolase
MGISRPRYYNRKRRYQRKRSKFKQGVFYPKNPDKFKQPIDETMNSTNGGMVYRSSWELAFAKYLDQSDNVIMWSSEPFAIKYLHPNDNKLHRYYIDFVFKDKENNKFLIEIKPKSQSNNPINQAKWKSAKQYAEKINATFLVITEKELKKWGII